MKAIGPVTPEFVSTGVQRGEPFWRDVTAPTVPLPRPSPTRQTYPVPNGILDQDDRRGRIS